MGPGWLTLLSVRTVLIPDYIISSPGLIPNYIVSPEKTIANTNPNPEPETTHEAKKFISRCRYDTVGSPVLIAVINA